VTANRSIFGILDEIAIMIYFSLSCVLSLFWAELYYIATDSVHIYSDYIRPWTIELNIAAYIGLVIFIFIENSSGKDDADGSMYYSGFSHFAAFLNFAAAIILSVYAIFVGVELRNVPIDLESRKERIKSLQVLASIYVISLIIKVCAYIFNFSRKFLELINMIIHVIVM
jgi:hypothetical protein